MGDLPVLDIVVLAVLGIAIVRGLFIGLIREGFSIAALGGALVGVRYGTPPLASALESASGGKIGETAASWLAGAALALAIVVAIGIAGRLLRRGAHAVGLGFADRIAGGVAGAAEGALVAAVIVVVALWTLGPSSSLLEGSKSVELLEALQTYLAENRDDLPDVATPPDWMRIRRES